MVLSDLLIITLLLNSTGEFDCYLPINTVDRRSTSTLLLTNIGEFGLPRKERPGVPAHYHTGIDIKRPTENYHDEPIFSIFEGIVVSMRHDGPYAQIIIEHGSFHKFWTVYEHIAGIRVNLYEQVKPTMPIARFMSKNELNKYGWQFDHFHFEILKTNPIKLKQDPSNPDRRFSSYSLLCFTRDELYRHFYNPVEFFKEQFRH